MSEVAIIGKMLSIYFAIVLYACAWVWSLEERELILSKLFIGFNLCVLIAWFIWSWKH